MIQPLLSRIVETQTFHRSLYLISVVIPVFNRPGKAARALRSVLAQKEISSVDLEIILVDDASVPPLQLIESDPRVKIVHLEHNSGPAAARNAGIREAGGEYIALLDSDDVWLDHKIAKQLMEMKNYEQLEPNGLHALVCGFYCPNRATGLLQGRIPRSADKIIDFVSGCWFAPGSTLFMRRSTFDRVGFYDERLRRMEDQDWFIRFAQLGGRLHVLPYVGAIVAPSNSACYKAVRDGTKIIEEKFLSNLDITRHQKEWRRLQAYFSLEHGVALLREGKRVAGVINLFQSFWNKPRLQIAIEKFWRRANGVPHHVSAAYQEMIQGEEIEG